MNNAQSKENNVLNDDEWRLIHAKWINEKVQMNTGTFNKHIRLGVGNGFEETRKIIVPHLRAHAKTLLDIAQRFEKAS